MNKKTTQSSTLLIGTNKGIYRTLMDKPDETEHVLDAHIVMRLRKFENEIYAATRSGLFLSSNIGKNWENLNVPQTEVYSVVKSPSKKQLFAGTHPAHLYISNNNGESWRELVGLQDLPSRDSWRLPRHRNEAHVRSLGTHPDAPKRLIAGIEVGGVHISENEGETWAERRDGLQNDVHHVLICGAEEYIASTGGGLYRTRDAGRSWKRLDEDLDHSYFRETISAGGRLYTAAARSSPPSWGGEKGADAALFESTDGGDSFNMVDYPGQPEDFILSWTVLYADEDDIIAGTRNGNILRRTDGKWTTFGSVPTSARAILAM